MEIKKMVHRRFWHVLLLYSIIGSSVNILINILFLHPQQILLIVNFGILLGLSIGYITTRIFKKDTLSVFIVTITILVMLLNWFFSSAGYLGGITMTMIMIIGYIYSMMLSHKYRLISHLAIISLMIFLLIYQANHLSEFKYVAHPYVAQILGTGIPYIILYILVNLSFSVLKDRFENMNTELVSKNEEINKMNLAIYNQNEALNLLNTHLEQLVEQRTSSLQKKTEQLSDYSFKNAHKVRGSLARILGLIYLKNLNTGMSDAELLALVEQQAKEMDSILHQISLELHEEMKIEGPDKH